MSVGRPAPLLPAPVARLAAYGLLAGLGALQWSRFVAGASPARGLLWVAAGLLTGVLVTQAAGARRPRARAGLAAAAGLALAVLVSGLDLVMLAPRHWDELTGGLVRGAQALSTVRLPYLGRDPWVLATVELSGAGLCWVAAVLATWPTAAPGPGPRALALVALLVLAASPIVSLESSHAVLLGAALAVLVVAFLWLERVARRGVAGLVALAGLALVAAVPLGGWADRDRPWFDYQAFSERFAAGTPVSFDWRHGYGPIDWPRDGAELFRVRSARPHYWKAADLTAFDGRGWAPGRVSGAGDEQLPHDWRAHPAWTSRVAVAVARLRSRTVVAPGTTLAVSAATTSVVPDVLPGPWIVADGRSLSAGDSYVVRSYAPSPSLAQLERATVDREPPGDGALTVHLALGPAARRIAPLYPQYPNRPPRHLEGADIRFGVWGRAPSAVAHYRATGQSGPADALLRRSAYARTWALARRLRRASRSPYDYVTRVGALLRRPAFRYTERPPPVGRRAPLEAFLFDTHAGYCQQYSGAMALLLRMGGVPARVASGFSPGGRQSSTGEWVVRDTDAHSWVEASFDGIGWVTLDPTPPDTPARSLVAAVRTPAPSSPGAAATPAPGRPVARRPGGITRDPVAAVARRDGGGLPPGWIVGLVLLATASAAGLAGLRHRLRAPADDGLAELERALRRSGRGVEPATTLTGLERRLGASGEGAAYLRALRGARYGARGDAPSLRQRAAFRRELASGLGPGGRLRALWAMPPRLRRRPRLTAAPVAQRIERPPPKR